MIRKNNLVIWLVMRMSSNMLYYATLRFIYRKGVELQKDVSQMTVEELLNETC